MSTEPDRITSIVHNTAHVAEGLALPTSQFQGLPVFEAILTTWLAQVQEAEDALWDVLTLCTLDDATFDALDQLGEVLGFSRHGLVDADYRLVLRALILARRSSGSVDEVLAVMSTIMADITATALRECPPASMTLEPAVLLPIGTYATAPGIVAAVLRVAKSAGVHVSLIVPPTGSSFMCAVGSSPTHSTTHGWGLSTDPTAGGYLAGLEVV